MAPWLRGLGSRGQEEQLQPCNGNGNGNGNNIKRVYTMSDQLICQLPRPVPSPQHTCTGTLTQIQLQMRSQA